MRPTPNRDHDVLRTKHSHLARRKKPLSDANSSYRAHPKTSAQPPPTSSHAAVPSASDRPPNRSSARPIVMRELTSDLARSRHIGDACALRDLALSSVAPNALRDAAAASGRAIRRVDLSNNALTSLRHVESDDLTWFSCANNALDGDALEVLGRGCERLRILTCSGNDGLRSLRGCERMASIAAIVASNCGIENVDAVRGLRELNTLALGSCSLGDVGDALSELPALRKVNLSRNGIKKLGLDALKSSRGLRELRLSHNELKTIPPCVARTPNLRILDIGHNKISDWGDVSALSDLQRLEQLTLRGCPIASDPAYVQRIARMCPGLKLLDGRKVRDALRDDGDERPPRRAEREEEEEEETEENGAQKETRRSIKDDAVVEHAEKKSKMKKEKKKKSKESSGDGDRSFVELFVASNKGRILEGEGAEREEEKDELKRTGVVRVFENKDLKRKGPCGKDALKTLLSTPRDAGTGGSSAWDDDVEKEPRKSSTKQSAPQSEETKPKKAKKDLREMTPEERKAHLKAARKRGY